MGICKAIRGIVLCLTMVMSCFSQASSTSTYLDVSNLKSIDDIIKIQNDFTPLQEQQPIAPKLVSTWLKVDVSQLTASKSSQVIYLDKPINSLLELYLVKQGKVVQKVSVPKNNSSVSRLQSISPHITYQSAEPNTQVYIHLRAPYTVKFDYHIMSEVDFKEHSQTLLFWYGIELGLLYFVALSLVSMALLAKGKHLALLGVYISLLAIQCSVNNGSIYFYLPVGVGKAIASFNGSWLILACASCLAYQQSYFSSMRDKNTLSYVIWGITGSLVAIAVISFGIQASLSNQFQALACLVTSAALIAMYYHMRREFKEDIWLMAGAWLPMLTLGLVWIGVQLGIIANGKMLEISRLAIATHILLLMFHVFINDKKHKERIVFYSLHDPDTGLSNRFALNQHLRKLAQGNTHHTLLLFRPLVIKSIRMNIGIEQANKHLNELISKLYLQLDTYGTVTLSDTTATKTEIFRLDDTTFGITLLGKLSLSQIEQYVCILSGVFEDGIEYKGTRLVDEIEVGVAHSPIHAKTAEGLIQRAMLALSTKAEHSDRWQIFDLANSVISERRMRISSAIKEAIDDDQFSLYLQPQVNLATGKVFGAEGLLRWFHPKLGQVPPDEFIPIAESSGLIHALTELVIEKGLNYQKQLIEQYPGHVLSLNMSGKDLAKKELLVHLITLVNELNLNPSQIVLEITESVTIANESNLKNVLDDYRSVGVKLAIDDFGTGYSSLAYLSRLGFDELKIDKQFIMDIETSTSNQTIAKAMSDMAHSLGLKVVAEGIESVESYTRLQHYGCDYGQGYFIAKPLAFDEYLQWLYKVSQSDDVKRYLTL
ncbi:EAL domain-containing protein [Pseudoalteromonas sp. JBTF-M23]|uniref:EAL domain-containing protein n=1 Tax=Pseudoalteromonas caenipelagi TaxID=2726988 RepID=A0A849VAV5_9GAMM|nr:EAL domain-containing protein [Pseudoalteromonas caenipelagi]NOU48947.1 EAL domain-containing protein [Pseudoalteromonas caenipelagi]